MSQLAIFTRVGAVFGLAVALTFGVYYSAAHAATQPDSLALMQQNPWVHVKSVPQAKYRGAGYQYLQAEGASLTPVMLPSVFAPVEVVTQEPEPVVADLVSPTQFLDRTANGIPLAECGQRYNPRAFTLMLSPKLPNKPACFTRFAATDKKTGQTIELVYVGTIKLGNITTPDAAVISAAAAKRFGYSSEIPETHILGLRKIRTDVNVNVASLPPVLFPDSVMSFAQPQKLRPTALLAYVSTGLGECTPGFRKCDWPAQFAISNILDNRAKDGRYPGSVEKVAKQCDLVRRKNRCEFDWRGKPRDVAKVNMLLHTRMAADMEKNFRRVKEAGVLSAAEVSALACTDNALFYRTSGHDRAWRKWASPKCTVGPHTFYTARR